MPSRRGGTWPQAGEAQVSGQTISLDATACCVLQAGQMRDATTSGPDRAHGHANDDCLKADDLEHGQSLTTGGQHERRANIEMLSIASGSGLGGWTHVA